MGRTDDRAGFSDDVRLRLIEVDLDKFDARMREMAADFQRQLTEHRAEARVHNEKMEAAMKRLTAIASALLVFFATTSLGIAINVLASRGGS